MIINQLKQTEDVDDLKKRHEVELEEFREKISQSRTRITRTVRISKNKNLIKLTINIDESNQKIQEMTLRKKTDETG